VWRRSDPGEELPTGEIIRGLDALRALGVVEIVFSGGNPLLREDIGEILAYASRSFITTVYDNGTLALKKTEELRRADFVAISLDSLDERTNDSIRGEGAWKGAMSAIDGLRREGFAVFPSFTISRLNLDEAVDFAVHFTDREIPVMYCLYSRDNPSERRMFPLGADEADLSIVDGEAAARMCDALRDLKRSRPGVMITTRFLDALKRYFLTGQRSWTCRALREFVMIDPMGRAAGCHGGEPVGSVFDLPRLWRSPEFGRAREKSARCEGCLFFCYAFYSVHAGVFGDLRTLWDRRALAASVLKDAAKLRLR